MTWKNTVHDQQRKLEDEVYAEIYEQARALGDTHTDADSTARYYARQIASDSFAHAWSF